MSLSKTLTSAVAAITVAGAVGLAYAQTSPMPAPTAADTSQPVNNTTPTTGTNMPSSTMRSNTMPSNTMPSSTMPSTTTTDTSVSPSRSIDLEPRADRN